jgi:hypothetical protein
MDDTQLEAYKAALRIEADSIAESAVGAYLHLKYDLIKEIQDEVLGQNPDWFEIPDGIEFPRKKELEAVHEAIDQVLSGYGITSEGRPRYSFFRTLPEFKFFPAEDDSSGWLIGGCRRLSDAIVAYYG